MQELSRRFYYQHCSRSGVANLTTDAYGCQGTPTQNATIAANVMYNVVTCGAAGGGSSGGSSGGGGSSTGLTRNQLAKDYQQEARLAHNLLPGHLKEVTIAASKNVQGEWVLAVFGKTDEVTKQVVATLRMYPKYKKVFSAPALRTVDNHAERQLATMGFKEIGVSQELCPACNGWFKNNPDIVIEPKPR